MAELTTDIFNKLKIWWNISFKEGNTEVYDKCNEVCYNLIGKHIEVHRYKKYVRTLNSAKMNDLVYVPEHYLDSNGILDKYYTKDDIVRICRDNKVVATHLFRRLKGELVEEAFNSLLREYYEWFINEETSSIFKSPVSVNVLRIMDEDKRKEVCDKFNVELDKV